MWRGDQYRHYLKGDSISDTPMTEHLPLSPAVIWLMVQVRLGIVALSQPVVSRGLDLVPIIPNAPLGSACRGLIIISMIGSCHNRFVLCSPLIDVWV